MKKLTYGLLGALALLCTGAAQAADRLWGNHAPPYTFTFGNHIDTHLELRLWKRDRPLFGIEKGDLTGWFYVYDVDEDGDGVQDVDPASGLGIVHHCTKQEHYDAGCYALWRVHAKPSIPELNGFTSMFLYHFHDHPIWLLGNRVVDGGLRGSRLHIHQPGSYTHMHWLTEGSVHEGTFLPSSIADVEALFGVDINVPAECNVSGASALTAGVVCPGYHMQIKVRHGKHVAFRHGGELIPLHPGVDNKSHLNLLTSYRSLPHGVLPGDYVETGEGGGGH
jgi:hypothetical protein